MRALRNGLLIVGLALLLVEIGLQAASLFARDALRNATAAEGVPLIESAKSVLRVPYEERNFLWAAHPDGRMYGEIAEDVLPVVLQLRPPPE